LHPLPKWLLAAAGLAVALAFFVPGIVWLRSEAVIERRYPLPSTTAKASTATKALARGAHLVAIAGCSDCHGADLEGRPLGRGSLLPVWSSNLRLLAQTMSDEEFERAIRTGITPDSESTWIMPAMDYAYMSEDDVASIVSYLRTLKPLGTMPPNAQFELGARFAIVRADIEPIAVRALESPPSFDLGPRYDGGRYLARVACSDCHGTDLTGSADAPDLTKVGRYSRAQFFALMHGGVSPDGLRLNAMSRPRFHALYDYEIDALYDYLSARAKMLEHR
jgi:mono/diheme cytochrome c family protein